MNTLPAGIREEYAARCPRETRRGSLVPAGQEGGTGRAALGGVAIEAGKPHARPGQ